RRGGRIRAGASVAGRRPAHERDRLEALGAQAGEDPAAEVAVGTGHRDHSLSCSAAAVAIRWALAIAGRVIVPPGTDGKHDASTTWTRRAGIGRPRVSLSPLAGRARMGTDPP